jgi:hypothetical protein
VLSFWRMEAMAQHLPDSIAVQERLWLKSSAWVE